MVNLTISTLLILNLFILRLLILKKTNNPINFGIILIIYSIIYRILISIWKIFYLYALIFYISIIRGLLIIILYFIRIISNELTTIKYSIDIIIIIIPLIIYLFSINYISFWPIDCSNIFSLNSSFWSSFQFLYSNKFHYIIIFIIIYLLIFLLLIIKICLTNKKALRQWKLY